MRSQDAASREVVRDALCLAAIACVSAIPSVAKLGFYSDDWGLLARYHFHGSADLFGIFPGRPVQAAHSFLLYRLFELQPLGYHLVNLAVIAAAVALLYALLVRLKIGRFEAFAVGLVFVLLPQLSTVRVWIAASQVPLSMTFALLSLHAQLTFARIGKPTAAIAAFAAAALSIAAYEIFAPLIVGFALVLLWPQRRDRRAIFLVTALGTLILAAVLYKVIASGRAGPIAEPERYLQGAYRLVSPAYDWRVDSSLNLSAAVEVHLWLTFKGWGTALVDLVSGKFSFAAVIAASVIALLGYWRMSAARVGPASPLPLLLLGVAAFALGHATFLLVPSILFSPTGMANRVLVAAAIGIAMIIVAAIRLLARWSSNAFAVAVAFVAFCAALRMAEIQAYWAEAPAIQRRILAAAEPSIRSVPAGSTVILDGVCPYHGPAVVFEAYWDVGGALSLALGREVNGDAVSPRMSLTDRGLETSIYRDPATYPYGPTLYVYNPNLRLLVPLTNAARARSYFSRTDRWAAPCPKSYIGHGVLI